MRESYYLYNMYGPWKTTLNEVSQGKTNIVWSHSYVESEKKKLVSRGGG